MTNKRENELFVLMCDYIYEFIGGNEDEYPDLPVDCQDAFWYIKNLEGNDFGKVLKEIIGMTNEEIKYFNN